MESRNAPFSLQIFNLLAILPSRKSVSIARVNITIKVGDTSLKNKSNMIAKIILEIVR
jgi:hypothetical protein